VSLDTLMTREAVIVRRSRSGPPDAGNNPTVVESRSQTRCFLEPTSGLELSTDRSTEIGSHRAFFAAGTRLDGVDRIEVEGHTYEVIGPPEEFHMPRGEHHVQVQLQEATG